MQKWKYKVLEFSPTRSLMATRMDKKHIENELNELGKQGWEVVSSFITTDAHGSTKKIIYTLKKEFGA